MHAKAFSSSSDVGAQLDLLWSSAHGSGRTSWRPPYSVAVALDAEGAVAGRLRVSLGQNKRHYNAVVVCLSEDFETQVEAAIGNLDTTSAEEDAAGTAVEEW